MPASPASTMPAGAIKKRDVPRRSCLGLRAHDRRPVLLRCEYPLAALSVPSNLSKQAETDENQGRLGCCLKSWLPVPGNSSPGKTKSVNNPSRGRREPSRRRNSLKRCAAYCRPGRGRCASQVNPVGGRQDEALGCCACVFSSPVKSLRGRRGQKPPTSGGGACHQIDVTGAHRCRPRSQGRWGRGCRRRSSGRSGSEASVSTAMLAFFMVIVLEAVALNR
jgi:hypothetical protein